MCAQEELISCSYSCALFCLVDVEDDISSPENCAFLAIFYADIKAKSVEIRRMLTNVFLF